MRTTRNRSLVLGLGTAVLCVSIASSQTETSPSELSRQVNAFLETWLVYGDVDSAVEKSLSPELVDEGLVPRDWYTDDGEYQKIFSDQYTGEERRNNHEAIASRYREYLKTFRNAILDHAKAVQPNFEQPDNIRDFVFTMNVETDQALWQFFREKEVPITFQEPSFQITQAEQWDQYSWVAPPTKGYQWRLPVIVEENDLNMVGVMCRLGVRLPVEDPMRHSVPVFMFWGQHKLPESEWKLWGITPVPVE